jgi:hypothetical protein
MSLGRSIAWKQIRRSQETCPVKAHFLVTSRDVAGGFPHHYVVLYLHTDQSGGRAKIKRSKLFMSIAIGNEAFIGMCFLVPGPAVFLLLASGGFVAV